MSVLKAVPRWPTHLRGSNSAFDGQLASSLWLRSDPFPVAVWVLGRGWPPPGRASNAAAISIAWRASDGKTIAEPWVAVMAPTNAWHEVAKDLVSPPGAASVVLLDPAPAPAGG